MGRIYTYEKENEENEILKALHGIDKDFYSEQYCVIKCTEETQNIVMDFPDHVATSMKDGSEVFVISLKPFEDVEDIKSTLEYCGCYTGQ